MSTAIHRDLSAQLDSALDRSPAFHELTGERRDQVREDLKRVLDVLSAEPAEALATDDSADSHTSLAPATQGAQAFGAMPQSVDFVGFVSALMQNVFQAIVDSSQEQMTAFMGLLQAAVSSTEDFARTEVNQTDAMSHLMGSLSGLVQLNGDRQIVPIPGKEEEVRKHYPGITEFGNATAQKKLLYDAQLQLARQRQQMLATIVIMGLNRIVVTDGNINAKVTFHVDTSSSDKVTTSSGRTNNTVDSGTTGGKAQVEIFDQANYTGMSQILSPGYYNMNQLKLANDSIASIRIPRGWTVTLYRDWNRQGPQLQLTSSTARIPSPMYQQVSSIWVNGTPYTTEGFGIRIGTDTSSDTTDSEGKLTTSADLMGEVDINFKSETYPLDHLAPEIRSSIDQKSGAEAAKTAPTPASPG